MATGTRAGRKTRKNKDGEEPSGGEECEEENAREKGAKGMTRRSDGGSRDEKGRMEKATRRTNATKMKGNRRIPNARAQTIRRQRSGPGWLGILEPPEDGVASRLGGSDVLSCLVFALSPKSLQRPVYPLDPTSAQNQPLDPSRGPDAPVSRAASSRDNEDGPRGPPKRPSPARMSGGPKRRSEADAVTSSDPHPAPRL